MSKVYVPNFTSTNCVEIRSSEIIRVYDVHPTTNSDVNYVDYYIKNGYMSTGGTAHFSQYSTLPYCQATADVTTEYGYRVDFPVIMLCSLAMIMTAFVLIRALVRTLFVDWRFA